MKATHPRADDQDLAQKMRGACTRTLVKTGFVKEPTECTSPASPAESLHSLGEELAYRATEVKNETATKIRNDTLHLLLEDKLDSLNEKLSYLKTIAPLMRWTAAFGDQSAIENNDIARTEFAYAKAVLKSLDEPMKAVWRGQYHAIDDAETTSVFSKLNCRSMSKEYRQNFCDEKGNRLPTMSFAAMEEKLSTALMPSSLLHAAIPQIMRRLKNELSTAKEKEGAPAFENIFSKTDIARVLAAGIQKEIEDTIPKEIVKFTDAKQELEQAWKQYQSDKEKGPILLNSAQSKIDHDIVAELIKFEPRPPSILSRRTATLSGMRLTPDSLQKLLAAGDCVVGVEFGLDEAKRKEIRRAAKVASVGAMLAMPWAAAYGGPKIGAILLATGAITTAAELAQAYGENPCTSLANSFEIENTADLSRTQNPEKYRRQIAELEICKEGLKLRKAFALGNAATLGLSAAAGISAKVALQTGSSGLAESALAGATLAKGSGAILSVSSISQGYAAMNKLCKKDSREFDAEACSEATTDFFTSLLQIGNSTAASTVATRAARKLKISPTNPRKYVNTAYEFEMHNLSHVAVVQAMTKQAFEKFCLQLGLNQKDSWLVSFLSGLHDWPKTENNPAVIAKYYSSNLLKFGKKLSDLLYEESYGKPSDRRTKKLVIELNETEKRRLMDVYAGSNLLDANGQPNAKVTAIQRIISIADWVAREKSNVAPEEFGRPMYPTVSKLTDPLDIEIANFMTTHYDEFTQGLHFEDFMHVLAPKPAPLPDKLPVPNMPAPKTGPDGRIFSN